MTRRREWVGKGAKRLVEIPAPPVGLPPVAGYSAWLDASDKAGLTFDSTQYLVTQWTDKSGNGLHATPPAVASPGTMRQANLMRGRRCVLMNPLASSHIARLDSNIDASDRTQTSFVVGMAHHLYQSTSLLSSSATGGRYMRLTSTGKLEVLKDGTGSLFATTTLSATAGTPFCACLILDTSTIEFRLNSGTPESTSNSTTFTSSLTTRIGDRSNFSEPFSGILGEIIVYPTALSGTDVTSVMTYLMRKWGIS